MTAVPAIYGDLTASQVAAYQAWSDALVKRGAHIVFCRVCIAMDRECVEGTIVAGDESAAWQRWHEARTATVPA